MKYITFVLGLFLVAGCATSSTTSSPVNIDGTWQGEYDGGMYGQPMFFTFNFICEGESLGGFVRGSFGPTIPGEEAPLENGKINGNNISFTHRSKNTQMTFKCKGKVDGDRIKIAFQEMTAYEAMLKRMKGRGARYESENRPIRSSDMILGSVEGLSIYGDVVNASSGEFTIIRVK